MCESEATANVLSVRKRGDSNNNKALGRNGNQPPRFAIESYFI
ncbi:hypothetical protein ACPCXF_04050 [Lysinibacillus agricola]